MTDQINSQIAPLKVIVVGRHTPDFGDTAVEILSQENVMFATEAEAAASQLRELRTKAAELGADVLLQNTPVILTTALIKIAAAQESGPRVGAIVSVPGPREADVTTIYNFDSAWDAALAAKAVNAANSRAKTIVEGATLTVKVDPVPKFVFSHIEWLLA